MSGCGTRIVLRGQKPLALCDRCPCFGSLFPPLAALTFAASSIICAFGLAAAAPRSPYRHLELCGIAQNPKSIPGSREAGRPTACLHTNISSKPKVRYKPKNLYRTFILYYWYYMIKVSSVPSFQRRNKTTPVKPIRCAPKWRHPWRCSQPWCSRRPSCQRCAGRRPARRSRRFQWRQPQRPCQSCSAASWRRKGCRQSG